MLRVRDGELATYTDGTGTLGHGRYETGRLSRNDEGPVPAPSDLIVVVAPPDHQAGARFMVEKLSEMGVAELLFLDTRHGQAAAQRGKLLSWAASGLEQSRGAWLMKTSDRLATFADLRPPFAVCDLGGRPETPLARTVVIGPEGGWARRSHKTHCYGTSATPCSGWKRRLWWPRRGSYES